jgi:hypothetical protein
LCLNCMLATWVLGYPPKGACDVTGCGKAATSTG